MVGGGRARLRPSNTFVFYVTTQGLKFTQLPKANEITNATNISPLERMKRCAFLADRAALDKWKRNHLGVNRSLRTGILSSDGVQISARNVEASFDKPERDFFPKSLAPRCARNPAHLSAVRRSEIGRASCRERV